MKRFGIIGAGRFGTALAETLAASGGEVILLDRRREVVQLFAQTPINAVQGDATNPQTLLDAGFAQCSTVVVAIGDAIESSVLATVNCKDIGVRTVVAKAVTDLHGKVLDRVGADMVVYPNRERALRLARSLMNRTPIDLYEIADGYSVAEITAPRSLSGRTLRESAARQKYGVTVLALRRHAQDPRAPRTTLIATGDEVIEKDDILVVFGPDRNLDELRDS